VSSFYTGLAAVASRLLKDKGQLVTLSRETGGTFDGATGEESGASTTTWTGYGAAFNYNKSEIDGVQVLATDLRLMLEAVSTVPLVSDQITVGGVNYHAIAVNHTEPGGTAIKYEIQLRI